MNVIFDSQREQDELIDILTDSKKCPESFGLPYKKCEGETYGCRACWRESIKTNWKVGYESI